MGDILEIREDHISVQEPHMDNNNSTFDSQIYKVQEVNLCFCKSRLLAWDTAIFFFSENYSLSENGLQATHEKYK